MCAWKVVAELPSGVSNAETEAGPTNAETRLPLVTREALALLEEVTIQIITIHYTPSYSYLYYYLYYYSLYTFILLFILLVIISLAMGEMGFGQFWVTCDVVWGIWGYAVMGFWEIWG